MVYTEYFVRGTEPTDVLRPASGARNLRRACAGLLADETRRCLTAIEDTGAAAAAGRRRRRRRSRRAGDLRRTADEEARLLVEVFGCGERQTRSSGQQHPGPRRQRRQDEQT